ncbi:MAG: hypothetical protein Q8L48_14085 [Archangium sp.]|nr:hypothetical protein [Archangium sp.]
MKRLTVFVLFLSACGGSQRLTYDGAVKGNAVVGRYFGANTKDLFHTSDTGLVHFDGSAWTKVMTSDAAFVSAGPGKVWSLLNGRLERVDAAGAKEDFTAQVSADGPPVSMGRGNGEVLICSGNAAAKKYFVYRFTGTAFERIAGPIAEPLTFELVRGRDDAFVKSAVPAVPFQAVVTYVAQPTGYAYFDGTEVSGPIFMTSNPEGVNLSFQSVSPRVPRAEGVVGLFSYDGAWLHPSRRPPPTGFYYWRADGRLGVFANLYGNSDWPTVYASTYNPGTGQYGSTLLDINGEADVHYWTAAWNGTDWVDKIELFQSVACIGVTCGGSRTGLAGELDDGTMVTAGNDEGVSGIWFVSP